MKLTNNNQWTLMMTWLDVGGKRSKVKVIKVHLLVLLIELFAST